MLKEVEAQVEIAAEFVEYMNVVHKYLLVNLSNGIGYTPIHSNFSLDATVTVLITLSFFVLLFTGNTCLNLAAVMQHKSAPVS